MACCCGIDVGTTSIKVVVLLSQQQHERQTKPESESTQGKETQKLQASRRHPQVRLCVRVFLCVCVCAVCVSAVCVASPQTHTLLVWQNITRACVCAFALLFTGLDKVLFEVSRTHNAYVQQGPVFFEQDVGMIARALHECLASIPPSLRARLSAIHIACQMHGAVLWKDCFPAAPSPAAATPLNSLLPPCSNLITWEDQYVLIPDDPQKIGGVSVSVSVSVRARARVRLCLCLSVSVCVCLCVSVCVCVSVSEF